MAGAHERIAAPGYPRAALFAAMALLLSTQAVRAEPTADRGAPATTWSTAAGAAASAGTFLPLTLTPVVGAHRASGLVEGGYDWAARAPALRSFVEARVWRRLAARVATRLDGSGKEVGPALGARLQLTEQDESGLNTALALYYKAEGFTEPEGEVEAVASFSRRWSAVTTLASFAYGQDPEGNERDAEATLSAMFNLAEAYALGVDGRGRFDLQPAPQRTTPEGRPMMTLQLGPAASAAWGPVVIALHAGAAVSRFEDGRTDVGPVVLAGIGTAL